MTRYAFLFLLLSACGSSDRHASIEGGGDTDGGFIRGDGGMQLPACSGTPFTSNGVLDVDLKVVHVRGKVTLKGQPLSAGTHASLQFAETKTLVSVEAHTDDSGNYDVALTPGTYSIDYAGGGSCTSALPCNGGSLKSSVSFESDGVLDLDVPSVTISGAVRANGAPAPSGTQSNLSFSLASGGSATVPLAPTYSVSLWPGTYTIGYSTTASQCHAPLPCTSGPLKSATSLTSDGALDLDIPSITVSGAITLDGAPLPSGAQGTLSFSLMSGGSTTVAIAPTFSVSLWPGTYAVDYSAASSHCDGTMPCNSGPLKSGLSLTSNGALDLDIPSVAVAGHVTLKGGALPASPNATLSFALTGGGSATFAVDDSYTGRVFPGVYTVSYSASGSTCQAPMPCNGGPVRSGVPLRSDGALDIDIPAVAIAGHITLNGGALPSSASSALTYKMTGGGSVTVPVASTYAVSVLPGMYSVAYAGTGSCNSALPCNGGPIKAAVDLNSDGALDVDIPSVAVSGNVRLNGSMLPAAPSGTLSFGLTSGSSATVGVATTYKINVLPGTYAVGFNAGASCAGEMPCTSGSLVKSTTLTSDGALDLDIPAVRITGKVTLDGMPLPDASANRGNLQLALASGGSANTDPFGATGPAMYAATIFPGHYIVRYDANESLCTPGLTSTLPCTNQIVAGCP